MENSLQVSSKNNSHRYKHRSKKTVWLICLLCGCLVMYAGVWSTTGLANVPLETLSGPNQPTFIAIDEVERNQQTGLLVLRLTDAQQQFLPGDWQVSFVGLDQLYAFGSFPSEETQYSGQQLFLFEGDQIMDLKVKNIPGKITQVTENASGTQIRISASSQDTTFYCFSSLVAGTALACNQLNIESGGLATWDPDNEEQILVSKPSGEIYTYNFADPGLVEVDATQDADRFSRFKTALDSSQPPATSQPSVFKVLSWIFVRTSAGWEYVKTPIFSTVSMLNNEGFGVFLTRTELKIFNAQAHVQSSLVSEGDFKKSKLLVPDLSTGKKL